MLLGLPKLLTGLKRQRCRPASSSLAFSISATPIADKGQAGMVISGVYHMTEDSI